jgi:general secretion pathway protein J
MDGFTLVELLVALGILALVAILSWRGLDGMVRAQAMTQHRSDQVVTLQSALAQWTTDLEALVQVSTLRPLDWDGQVLRMTRRSLSAPTEGLLVIGWSTRVVNGQTQWLRWQSPPVRDRGDLQRAWAKAASWARNPSTEDQGREVLINPISDWQVFYFRGNAWSSPFSSAGNGSPGLTAGTADVSMPDGVRLVLGLPSDHPLVGKLTLDWARPTLSGGKN